MEVIAINNVNLTLKQWEGKRIITLPEVDKVHGRNRGTSASRFRTNKDKFIVGQDYFVVTKREFDDTFYKLGASDTPKQRPGNPNINMILLTLSGYLMLVKVMNDPLSWIVQKELVNTYFKSKEKQSTELIPKEKEEAKTVELDVKKSVSPTIELQDFLTVQKEIMEKEAQKNADFREMMTQSFSMLSNIIINQNQMIEKLMEKKSVPVDETAIEVKDILDAANDFQNWKQGIYNIIGDRRAKNEILSETYNYMRKTYGIVWEQHEKEFYECFDRRPVSKLELIYWMEQENNVYKKVLQSCVETIMCDKTKGDLIFPAHSITDIKSLMAYIGEKWEDHSPYNAALFRKFFAYLAKKTDIKWDKFENKFRRAYNLKPSATVSKLMIAEFSPTVNKLVIEGFNEWIKEEHEEIDFSLALKNGDSLERFK